jgi:hypothetical protein
MLDFINDSLTIIGQKKINFDQQLKIRALYKKIKFIQDKISLHLKIYDMSWFDESFTGQ